MVYLIFLVNSGMPNAAHIQLDTFSHKHFISVRNLHWLCLNSVNFVHFTLCHSVVGSYLECILTNPCWILYKERIGSETYVQLFLLPKKNRGTSVASSIPARYHTFVEIEHEIISTVILLPSADLFKKGCCQLQAKVCAQITG